MVNGSVARMYRLIAISLLFLMACQTRQEQKQPITAISIKIDSIQQLHQDSILKVALRVKEAARIDSLMEIIKSKPIWGKRLSITGDFDGDGIQETLMEQYISRKTGKEVNKKYDWEAVDLPQEADTWDKAVEWAIAKEPKSVLKCSNPNVKPYVAAKGGQIFGLLYLNNEGDLNGDSTDEITCIVDWADYSNSNSCRLLTYKEGQWKLISTFDIMEFDFQYNPDTEKFPHPKYVFKKPNGKIYLKEYDGNVLGNTHWINLKTNW